MSVRPCYSLYPCIYVQYNIWIFQRIIKFFVNWYLKYWSLLFSNGRELVINFEHFHFAVYYVLFDVWHLIPLTKVEMHAFAWQSGRATMSSIFILDDNTQQILPFSITVWIQGSTPINVTLTVVWRRTWAIHHIETEDVLATVPSGPRIAAHSPTQATIPTNQIYLIGKPNLRQRAPANCQQR